MRDDPSPPATALDAAQQRLERALDRLERGLKARTAALPAADDARARQERLRLESELRGARTRERQLEQVAAEASAALGRAAAEVRAALQAEA